MKKSKVLIPAMALLLFSTAASITGTVAWFTSTRSFTSSAGKFQVASLEGNLACVVTDGTATTLDGENANNIEFDGDARLGDASFNHTSGHLYTDVPEVADSFEDLGAWALNKRTTPSTWYYGSMGSPAVYYYYAATWQYTFTYSFKAEQTDLNLFFDVNNSTYEYYKNDGTAHGEEAADTALGFRLAFASEYTMSTANDSHKEIVWAPFRAQGTWDHDGDGEGATPTAEVATIRHVKDEDEYGTYGTELLDSSAKTNTSTYGLGDAGDSKAATLANCIGVFKKPTSEGNVSITVKMTAWFEGTDPNIVTVTGKKFQQVSANLVFKVRKAPVTP